MGRLLGGSSIRESTCFPSMEWPVCTSARLDCAPLVQGAGITLRSPQDGVSHARDHVGWRAGFEGGGTSCRRRRITWAGFGFAELFLSSLLKCLSEMRGLSLQHIPSPVLAHVEQLVTQLSSTHARHHACAATRTTRLWANTTIASCSRPYSCHTCDRAIRDSRGNSSNCTH